jgi:hypothetical protein
MSRRYVKPRKPYYPDEVFHTLRATLHGLLGHSDHRCAEAMGVTAQTWRKWHTTPPKNPWMTHSLYWCCYIHFHGYQGKYKSEKWEQRSQMAKRMQGLHKYFGEHIPAIETISAYTGSEKHLARLLCKRGMYWHDIKKPANAGGYSPRQLQIAAQRLGVVKTQKGFGEDNESWWEWPAASVED